MKKVTFLHCADLHLDSPMLGLKYLPEKMFKRLQESTFKALHNVIDAAIWNEVDFVIIAGDLFDGEDRSLRAQARFRKEMDRLFEQGIQVFMVHGNHDHLGGKWPKMQWPENVHVYTDNVEVKTFKKDDGTTAHLYGFSYPKRHVTERWIEKYEKKIGADFHIGILHGHFDGVSDHGKYAPFHLSDLLEKQLDYWALGHIHKKSILSHDPPIIYPGNTQGRHRQESGEKGCYIITLTDNGAEYHFQEASDVLWAEKILDGSTITNFNDLYNQCIEEMENFRVEGKGVVLTLDIQNLYNKELNAKGSNLIDELLETLQEQEKEEEHFVWIREIKCSAAQHYNRTELGEFFQELFTTVDQFDHWDETLSPLYRHNSSRRHLDSLTDKEKQQILHEAEEKLLQLLHEK